MGPGRTPISNICADSRPELCIYCRSAFAKPDGQDGLGCLDALGERRSPVYAQIPGPNCAYIGDRRLPSQIVKTVWAAGTPWANTDLRPELCIYRRSAFAKPDCQNGLGCL